MRVPLFDTRTHTHRSVVRASMKDNAKTTLAIPSGKRVKVVLIHDWLVQELSKFASAPRAGKQPPAASS